MTENAQINTASCGHTHSDRKQTSRRDLTVSDSSTLYNSQIGGLIFCCSIVFKISSLPGLVSSVMHSSTLWLYIFMCCLDIVMVAVLYAYACSGADAFLVRTGNRIYRIFNAAACAYFLLKGFLYFVYTVIFLTIDLFVGVAPFVIIIVLAVPVVYMGVKGIRGIARSGEALALILFAIVVLNLSFLRADMDFGRNLPLAALPKGDFFKEGLRFSLWLGDLFPLMFLKVSKKKAPYAAIGTGAAYAVVLVIAMLAVAMYGNALPYVYNMLIRIAGFNQLSLEIGRLEWAALFVVLTMVILELSLLFWGSAESCRRAFGTALPAQLAFTALITGVTLAVPTLQDVVTFSTSKFGYAMFAAACALALGLTAFRIYYAKKRDADSRPRQDGTEKNRTELRDASVKTAQAEGGGND